MMYATFQVDLKYLKEADEILGTAYAAQYEALHPAVQDLTGETNDEATKTPVAEV